MKGRFNMTQLFTYLDDIKEGTQFQSKSYLMSEERIIAFAKQFDPQPFHTDPVAAKDTIFKRLVASGWHTLAVNMKMLVETLPLTPGAMMGAGADVKWVRPVYPGESIYSIFTMKEIKRSKTKPQQGICLMEAKIYNQDDELVTEITHRAFGYFKSEA